MNPDDVRLWRELIRYLSREDLARLRTEPPPPRAGNPMTFGVQVPIPEDLITELGEQGALTIARNSADRIAQREHGSSNLATMHDVVQLVPATDPDTGAELPPMRLYRFTYH